MRSGSGRVGNSRWLRTAVEIWVQEDRWMGVIDWRRAPVVCLGMHIVKKRLIPGTKDDSMIDHRYAYRTSPECPISMPHTLCPECSKTPNAMLKRAKPAIPINLFP